MTTTNEANKKGLSSTNQELEKLKHINEKLELELAHIEYDKRQKGTENTFSFMHKKTYQTKKSPKQVRHAITLQQKEGVKMEGSANLNMCKCVNIMLEQDNAETKIHANFHMTKAEYVKITSKE